MMILTSLKIMRNISESFLGKNIKMEILIIIYRRKKKAFMNLRED